MLQVLLQVVLQTTAVELEINQKYPGCKDQFGWL